MRKRNIHIFCIIGIVLLNIYPIINMFSKGMFDLFGVFNLIGLIILLMIRAAYKNKILETEYNKKTKKKLLIQAEDVKTFNIYTLIELTLSVIFITISVLFD